MDIRLVQEMDLVSREDNGTVNLNGRDRVVAACIAVMAREQANLIYSAKKPKVSKETNDKRAHEALRPKKENGDIFG